MTVKELAVTTRNDCPSSPTALPEIALARPPAWPPGLPGPAADACSHRSYLELEALAIAVPQARRHIRGTLAQWGLSQIAPDAELITSELVTNAVSASAASASAGLLFRPGVGLLVAAHSDRLIVMVQDASQEPPVLRPPADDAMTGRGLGIVAALSTRWGWVTDAGGKIVWAMVDLGQV
jgi:anti-sigma regulatory factor (Ser/Thr protein kinase)